MGKTDTTILLIGCHDNSIRFDEQELQVWAGLVTILQKMFIHGDVLTQLPKAVTNLATSSAYSSRAIVGMPVTAAPLSIQAGLPRDTGCLMRGGSPVRIAWGYSSRLQGF